MKKIFERVSITLLLLFILIFGYFYGVKGLRPYIMQNPQNAYGKFLIKQNDELVELMFEFEEKSEGIKDREFKDEEKDELTTIILKQNQIIERIQKHLPNEENEDYLEIYQDFLTSHAFFLQGQLMKMEYLYDTEERRRDETIILGQGLSNLMGNLIIEMPDKINSIRGTNYSHKYSYDGSMPVYTGDNETLQNLLNKRDDSLNIENNEDLNKEDLERILKKSE